MKAFSTDFAQLESDFQAESGLGPVREETIEEDGQGDPGNDHDEPYGQKDEMLLGDSPDDRQMFKENLVQLTNSNIKTVQKAYGGGLYNVNEARTSQEQSSASP